MPACVTASSSPAAAAAAVTDSLSGAPLKMSESRSHRVALMSRTDYEQPPCQLRKCNAERKCDHPSIGCADYRVQTAHACSIEGGGKSFSLINRGDRRRAFSARDIVDAKDAKS